MIFRNLLPWDNVDEEQIMKPVRFDIKNLLHFTLFIGPISSVFDIITFAVMWFVISANTVAQQSVFQSGWFLVGLFTQTLVVHVIRTEKIPFIQSVASPQMLMMSALATGSGLCIILFEPLRQAFDFGELPREYWIWLIVISFSYLVLQQLIKKLYIKKYHKWI